jgi:4-amino-4-deoxy-L-arabinose transferase-like glycosyltransferase
MNPELTNGSRWRTLLLEALVIAGIIAAGTALLQIRGVTLNNNGAIYLLQADRLMESRDPGLTFADRSARGPVFPAVLAAAMAVGGKTVAAAMFAVRLWFVAGLLAVYALQRVLFGRAVAVATVLLVATSNGLNLVATSLDTDPVMPTLVCAFLFTYAVAHRRVSPVWAFIAGIVLALTVLTKESGIGFLLVPLASLASRDRTAALARRVVLPAYAAALLPLLAWAATVAIVYGSVAASFGMMHPSLQHRIADLAGAPGPVAYWGRLFTLGAPGALKSYYAAHLVQASPLAAAFVLAWVIVLGWAVTARRFAPLLLVAAVVGFLPVILRLGDYPNARVGQSTVTFMLSYLALGGSVFLLAAPVTAKAWRRATSIIIVLAGSAGAWYQVTHAAGPIPPTVAVWTQETGDTFPLSIATSDSPFKVRGRFTEDQEAAARWLIDHAGPDPRVAGDGYTNEAIDFFLTTRTPVKSFHPVVTLPVMAPHDFDGSALGGPAIIAFSYNRFKSGGDSAVLYLSSQQLIRSSLLEDAIEYVVVSGRGQWIGDYLAKVPWARRVFQASSVHVFEIDRSSGLPPVPWPDPCTNESFPEHMTWLRSAHPEDARTLVAILAAAGLNLDHALRTSCLLARGHTP